MGNRDFERQLQGWSLTTAEIMYRMPDFRNVLQTYIWQDYDLEGPLAQVRVAHAGIIGPVELRHIGAEWKLH